MKVQSTFYIDFISKTVDVLLISSFITKQMPKLLIFDEFVDSQEKCRNLRAFAV